MQASNKPAMTRAPRPATSFTIMVAVVPPRLCFSLSHAFCSFSSAIFDRFTTLGRQVLEADATRVQEVLETARAKDLIGT